MKQRDSKQNKYINQTFFSVANVFIIPFVLISCGGGSGGKSSDNPADSPPVASFSVSTSAPRQGQLIEFDASSSSDPDGEIVSYEWDYDGNGSVDGNGQIVSHVYPQAGRYIASLRVINNSRLSDAVSHTMVVQPQIEPVAAFTFSPDNQLDGQPVSFNATTSSDADGTITNYQWDMDDDGNYDSTGIAVNYTYPAPGTYTARLHITDNDGITNDASVTVTIRSQIGPVAAFTFSPDHQLDGQPVSFNATTSSDADGTITSYQWDMDDDGNYDSTGIAVNYVYPAPGTYTARLHITDNDGITNDASATVTIRSQILPVAAFTFSPNLPMEGVQITFDASGSIDSDGTIASYQWDFNNDGNFDNATGLQVSHSFPVSDSYPIGLRVIDNDGLSATTSITISVSVLDSDGDGMPNDWEILHGLDPMNAVDKLSDPDGDSIANIDEYLGNTNPNTADAIIAQLVIRGPYLQSVSQTGVIVRWNTSSLQGSYIYYGPSKDEPLQNRQFIPESVNVHQIQLTGLSPDSRYYYRIAQADAPGVLSDPTLYFDTSPDGVRRDARFWFLGDSGAANANARAVRDSFSVKATADNRPANGIIMLGDNAYEEGTDAEFQSAVFDVFSTFLKNTTLWTTFGNHEGRLTSDGLTQSGDYFDIFSLPKTGGAGGVASGTETYYSYDHGQVHIVILDSFASSRLPNSTMLAWLENDLSANNKLWTIVCAHHSPYSKDFAHDSDIDLEGMEVRQYILPILDAHNVDLVITAHSHQFTRSFLIKNHYGLSNTFDPLTMGVDMGDGREDGDGIYTKTLSTSGPEGTVYVVAGNASRLRDSSFDLPITYFGEKN